jgi:hypothetical protein
MVAYSYLNAGDYAAAERVAGERLRAVEARGSAAEGHLPIVLMTMAETYRLQGKFGDAFPLYSRLYEMWLADRLPAEFLPRTQRAYIEGLIMRGETAIAAVGARPAVNPDGSDAGV